MYKKVVLIFFFEVAVASFAGSVQAMLTWGEEKAINRQERKELKKIARHVTKDQNSIYRDLALNSKWKKRLDEHARERLAEWQGLKKLKTKNYNDKVDGNLISYKALKKLRRDAWIKSLKADNGM